VYKEVCTQQTHRHLFHPSLAPDPFDAALVAALSRIKRVQLDRERFTSAATCAAMGSASSTILSAVADNERS
jgi:hypothetical protein